MGVEENGLTLEGLAQRLKVLERENERMHSENDALRSKVATPEGSGMRHVEEDEPFGAKMRRLVAQWGEQQAEARRLDAAIEANLKTLGYTINEFRHFR